MISLRTSYLLLVLSAMLLTLALASHDTTALMLAVAVLVVAGQVLAQALEGATSRRASDRRGS